MPFLLTKMRVCSELSWRREVGREMGNVEFAGDFRLVVGKGRGAGK